MSSPTCKPEISEIDRTLFKKGSNYKANNIGEREQPCQVLLDIGKDSENTPFPLTKACGAEYALEIKMKHLFTKTHMSQDCKHQGPVHPVKGLPSICI